MKRLIIGGIIITALLLGCKKKEETTGPGGGGPQIPSSPSVPSPTITVSFPQIDPNQTPDPNNPFVQQASQITNSTIDILNSVTDSFRFNWGERPEMPMGGFSVQDSAVFTWDSAGINFKLVIVTEPGYYHATLYVNGTDPTWGVQLNNFILTDVTINYNVVDSDTFGDGIINFYIVKDSFDTVWENTDELINVFWKFYVYVDTVDYLMAIDTSYFRNSTRDIDFEFFHVFGVDKPNNYVEVGVSLFSWFLYHIVDYYSDTTYDILDYVFNPALSVPASVSFPHTPYEIIPKLKKNIRKMKTFSKIGKLGTYDGWYYGIRFEINPQYATSADTARLLWDDPDDNQTDSGGIPIYPTGPFTVPPFDGLLQW